MRALKGLIVACVAVVAMLSYPGKAHATLNVTCTVGAVAWTDSGSGTVQINCGGAWYYAFGSSSTCSTTSSDGKKEYMSMAQSALLSGKTIYLEYSTCTGGPALSYVKLNP